MKTAILWLSSASVLFAQPYVISTFAGGAALPTPIPAVNAPSLYPGGIAVHSGNLYFSSLNCVFKVDANGILTRVAGNSRQGYSGDGGQAISAQFNFAGTVAVDGSGNIYVADPPRVRKISPDGVITTAAGNGTAGFSGDGGRATDAQLAAGNLGLAVDSRNSLYIADQGRIRKVSTDGSISTVAGNGAATYSGDGGLATNAGLGTVLAIAMDRSGNLYIAGNEYDSLTDETFNSRVRVVTMDGVIKPFAGTGIQGYSGDGGPAISAQISYWLSSLAVDTSGNLYIVDAGNHRIRKVTPDGIITSLTTQDQTGCYVPGSGPYVCALLVAPDASGRVYISGQYSGLIQRLDPDGSLTTIAGGGSPSIGDGGPATSAQLSYPIGVAIDILHNLYIADSANNRIRKITPDGTITTVAGDGTTSAQLHCFGISCQALAADSVGNLFIADGERVQKVAVNGIVTTVVKANVHGLATDGANVYIADMFGARILKVSADGTITSIAGNGTLGHSGDGGLATLAHLFIPADVAVDGGGNVYIGEIYPGHIRKVSPDGIITSIAGNGTAGYSGDGGPATGAQLANDLGIAADRFGNVYIADFENNCIRKVSTDGIITTIAGSSSGGYSGDGGTATSAQLLRPARLAVDGAIGIYISDFANNAIRLLQPAKPLQ
jgi:sugar lactone lactonase YvrE